MTWSTANQDLIERARSFFVGHTEATGVLLVSGDPPPCSSKAAFTAGHGAARSGATFPACQAGPSPGAVQARATSARMSKGTQRQSCGNGNFPTPFCWWIGPCATSAVHF